MQKNLIEESISRLIGNSVTKLKSEFPRLADSRVEIEIPKDDRHGDLATNIALRLAGVLGVKPMDVAAKIVSSVQEEIPRCAAREIVRSVEVKPPGFINFWLSDAVFRDALADIHAKGADFGRSDAGKGAKVLIEFVSANPTGPLTVAHARQAAFGDSLANILEFCGYKVTREYYINDEGVQMSLLADSVAARYLELHRQPARFPENGYKGAYIYEIARDVQEKHKDTFLKDATTTKAKKDFFLRFSCDSIMAGIRQDLKDFHVRFDVWYSQATLAASGKVEKELRALREKGYLYDHEGASWFKSTAFGDDKDRVVIKSDASYTYLAPDIAYHKDKFARGFDSLIDIWGPDHHGYIPRIKAAIQAMGYAKGSLSVIIIQLATLFRDGKPVSMSTRQGEFVTLRELLDEVGKDAGRFFFLMRKSQSHLDFDLALAKQQSSQNPVYYVQYAHARICSISEKSDTPFEKADLRLLKEGEELDLMKYLWRFPLVVRASGQYLEPYGLIAYLQELARAFHAFYDKHRVMSDDADLTKARLFLVHCTKTVIATGLELIGVSAPAKM